MLTEIRTTNNGWLMALALLTLMGVAGCGGSSDDDSDSGDETPEANEPADNGEGLVDVADNQMQFFLVGGACYAADQLVTYHDASGNLQGTATTDSKGRASIDEMPDDGYIGIEVGFSNGAGSYHYPDSKVEGGEVIGISDSGAGCEPDRTFSINITNENDYDATEFLVPVTDSDKTDEPVALNPFEGTDNRVIVAEGFQGGERFYGIKTIDTVESGETYDITVDQDYLNLNWNTDQAVNSVRLSGPVNNNQAINMDMDTANSGSDLGTSGTLERIEEPEVDQGLTFSATSTEGIDSRKTVTNNKVLASDANTADVTVTPASVLGDVSFDDEQIELGALPNDTSAINQTSFQKFWVLDGGEVYRQNHAVDGVDARNPVLEIPEESSYTDVEANANNKSATVTLHENPLYANLLSVAGTIEVAQEESFEQSIGDTYRFFSSSRTE